MRNCFSLTMLVTLIGGLAINGAAQAQQGQQGQYMDPQIVPLFTTVGKYSDDLEAGHATAAEPGACQNALNQLNGLVAQASSPAATPHDKMIASQIQREFAQMDPNPCPTIESYQAGGSAAFKTSYDLSTPQGGFAAEKAGVLQRFNIVGQYNYNVQHNVPASAAAWQQAQQACTASFQMLNNFVATAQQEAQSPSGLTPGDASLLPLVTQHLQDPRVAPGCPPPPASAVTPY